MMQVCKTCHLDENRRCRDCGYVSPPIEMSCPHCGATDHDVVEAFGARIYACPRMPSHSLWMAASSAKVGVRPPREDYVRVTREANGFTLEPAVEYRDGDNFRDLSYALTCIAIDAGYQSLDDQMVCARWAANRIASTWPDRAYFVEVWQEGREGFAQIFQPFGVPRNR